MTTFLIDTNVLSEPIKARPDPNVVAWLDSPKSEVLSALTIGEAWRGIGRLRQRDPARAGRLAVWMEGVESQFSSRILPIDVVVVRAWATLPAHRTLPAFDSLIAATALAHGLTVATRNTRDFAELGIRVVNPFEG